MVFVTDSAGLVTHLGRHWTRLTGQAVTEARNFGWTRVVHPDDRDPVRDLVLEAIRLHSGFTVRFRLRSTEGKYVWVVSGAVPSFGPPGRTFLGFLGSLMPLEEHPTDITGATGWLRAPEPPNEPGSPLERAADHLLAAHSLIAQSGRLSTLEAVESALRRLGAELAEETLIEGSSQTNLH